MVRTADSAVRVGGKASKKSGNSSSGASSSTRSPSDSGEKGFSGYNSVCHRETPGWQRPITSFFTQADKSTDNQSKQSTSKVETMENEQPQINTNDETMELETSDVASDEDSNKENDAPEVVASASKERIENDTEMNELNENAKKKINLRDDYDDDTVPKKKRKLDTNAYEHFEMLEQSKMMS